MQSSKTRDCTEVPHIPKYFAHRVPKSYVLSNKDLRFSHHRVSTTLGRRQQNDSKQHRSCGKTHWKSQQKDLPKNREQERTNIPNVWPSSHPFQWVWNPHFSPPTGTTHPTYEYRSYLAPKVGDRIPWQYQNRRLHQRQWFANISRYNLQIKCRLLDFSLSDLVIHRPPGLFKYSL